MERSDSQATVSANSLWRVADRYLLRAPVFVSPARPDARSGAWSIGYGRSTPFVSRRSTPGLASSRATLMCLCRVLGPRRESSPMAMERRIVAPAAWQNEGSPRVRQSRGSIARPQHWLSTLRRECRHPPRKTRFRPPDQAYRVGLVTHRAAAKGFCVDVLHHFLLSRASLAAMPPCHTHRGEQSGSDCAPVTSFCGTSHPS